MINIQLLSLFIPTMFLISITPGMCMTLAMTLGMSIGVRRTVWMMLGELVAVALIATFTTMGVATIMSQMSNVFTVFKLAGAAYLVWLGIELWRSRGAIAISEQSNIVTDIRRRALAFKGFMTAVLNPKGWAFFIAILPPFIDPSLAFAPQMIALVGIIVLSEFICMTIYAVGGRSLRTLLSRGVNVRVMNRISGTLMMSVGIWLAIS